MKSSVLFGSILAVVLGLAYAAHDHSTMFNPLYCLNHCLKDKLFGKVEGDADCRSNKHSIGNLPYWNKASP